MLTVMDLRKSFVEYFKEKGHKIVPSSSLLPKDDPTLLFTTAGMVQFKPMFAGTVELEYTRAASVQKCLRTSDLENVGKTKRHLTFFEMLGNFSFGDYFKKEAIEFAWDFSTSVMGINSEKIWVSIYEDDDEAFGIWKNDIGVPEHKIVRLGKADNFWGPAGDSGACGPCSELYIDRGPEFGCGFDDCKPGCECERFMEYWNLVFNQFNQDINGNLNPLPRTGIDTGMGLERLATLLQGVDSVYETDEFKTLTEFIASESGIKYEGDAVVPMRVMAEHARSLSFAMTDGIYPSNEGRGYVLRRILRRALRYSRQLGIKEPFIYRIVDPVVSIMGEFYPELAQSASNIKSVIESEEKRFLDTIENGMSRLDSILSGIEPGSGSRLSGRDAFVLYDTFGFPYEMTAEIAAERGVPVDREGFEAEMESQRERGRQSWKAGDEGLERFFDEAAKQCGDTVFTGYADETAQSKISAIYTEDGASDIIEPGRRAFLVLDRTPFYGESGGQVGDIGVIAADGARFRVLDTKKNHRTVIHLGELESGKLKKGQQVTAEIDSVNRNLIRANHTATHLLQAALRKVLGEHVKQAGSIVDSEKMRFDFSHFSAMTDEEIYRVEELVNRKIWENREVGTEIMPLEKAVESGAMAVFDEKYEDTVRVVSVEGFSKELCGGTHVSNTGKIGVFSILREMSPGAGVRRIEAATLRGVLERYKERERFSEEICSALNISERDALKRIAEIQERLRGLEKEIKKLKGNDAASAADSLIASAKSIGPVKFVSQALSGADGNELKSLADAVREKLPDSVVCLGSEYDGKAILVYAATSSAVKAGFDCGKAMKQTAALVGGGGGGRPDMAQAGGKNPAGISGALQAAEGFVENAVS